MRASKLSITFSRLLVLLFSLSSRGGSGTSTCGTLLSAYNASITYLGCYTDGNVRTLQGLSSAPNSLNSPQYCANLCGGLGYKYSGVETA
jgi:xylan 1,4-beta-xylosidase